MQPVKLSGPERLHKWGTGVCLIAAPLGSVVVTIAHPKTVNLGAPQLAIVAANLGRWNAVHTLLFWDLALMVPAVLGLVRLLYARRPGTALAGGALSLLGILAGAGAATDELIVGAMAQMEDSQAQMAALFDRVHGQGGFFIFLLATFQPIGFMVLAWGLYQAGLVAPWAAGALGLGALLEALGLPTALPAVTLAGHVLELVGMGWIGLEILRQTDEEWARPAPLHRPAAPRAVPAPER
jgi:hypothetical protein